jgi:ATP-dependent helicase/nuclease subunit A
MHEESEVRQWTERAQTRPKLSDRQQRLARLEPLAPAPPPHAEAERVRQRLTHEYEYGEFTRIAAAQTVGSLTKLGRRAFGGESESRAAIVTFGKELPSPRCVLESLTASPMEVGSVTHLVLQHLDFARSCSADDIKRQVRQMIDRKLVPRAEVELVDVAAIEWLMSTPLGELLRKNATVLRRELPVFYPMRVEISGKPASPDPLDQVMVRGRIDVMIPDASGLVLVDYKTDRVTRETVAERAEFYRPQVQSYREALEGILDQPVKSVQLVFLAARQIISS